MPAMGFKEKPPPIPGKVIKKYSTGEQKRGKLVKTGENEYIYKDAYYNEAL